MEDNSKSFKAALGAFLGVCVGDAAGATREFPCRDNIEEEKVTDDSEMAISLALALTEGSQPPNLPAEEVANMYIKWLETKPFGVGRTSLHLLSNVCGWIEGTAQGSVSSRRHDERGQADGRLPGKWSSVMRVVPVAIWGHRLASRQIAACAQADAALTHVHRHCQDCNAIYCIALGSLIRQPGDAEAAIAAAKSWAWWHAASEVRKWLQEALELQPLPSVSRDKSQGWVRWGFTLAFRHLKQASSFEAALKHTLSMGGDTDTNAAIVCAMIGALHGADAIPSSWKQPVFAVDAMSREGLQFPRPAFLHSHQVPDLCRRLFTAAETYDATGHTRPACCIS